MFAPFVLSFREILEIGLLSILIITYLSRAGLGHLVKYVWHGIIGGAVISVILGAIAWQVFGGLPEPYEKLFEAVASVIAAVVLTVVFFWLARHRGDLLEQKLQKHVDAFKEREAISGIFFFAFLVVLREGLEIVLFLFPYLIKDPANTILGFSAGTFTALVLSFAMYRYGTHIDVNKIFYYSSLIIVLIVAGMLGYGVHEFIEFLAFRGIEIGWLGQFVYDLHIPSSSIWSHKGILGAPFAILFGYSTKMEWARLLIQIAYLSIFIPLTVRMYRQR
ncbi:MAG: FTR1 family protein [Candidatus Paceibacterota bacterium]|jgi:high-affinity iron transporter|nr:FTR1 family protein [Candidatus Paceibacterota bacterium]